MFNYLKNDPDTPVNGLVVRVQQHGDDSVRVEAVLKGRPQGRLGRVVEAHQPLQGGLSDHAALVDWCQDGKLVLAGFAEAPAVVQVDGVGRVAEDLEGLVVVSVHVAHKKV